MYNLEALISHTKDLSLLYVEDDKDTREKTLILLKDLFDEVLIAKDAKEGLEKYKNNDIDIIITDINMSYMSGLEMCKMIKEINFEQSIIILTAITDISTIKDAIDIGIDGLVNKPLIDIEILLLKLNQIIKKRNYGKKEKALIKAQYEKEKTQLIVKMIKNISHHWKQPLSLISTITSGFSMKIQQNMKMSFHDMKLNDKITKKTKELSSVLEKLENLDYDNITLKEIEDILYISNPIYEEDK